MSDSLQLHGLYSLWNSPGQNTGVVCHFLLQGIFPTKGLNPGLLHCRQILYQLSSQGSPLRPWDMTIFPTVQQVPYIGTFRLQTFKDVNMHLHVQSRYFTSGLHCHTCASSKVTVLLCTLLYRTVWNTISVSHSVGPDSLRPHGLKPTRLCCP